MLRLRAVEKWRPTLALCTRLERKSVIQQGVEAARPIASSFSVSQAGSFAVKAELNSTESRLA